MRETARDQGREPTPTARLTRRLAAGEEEAFREFHGAYFDRLYRHLLVLTRGEETATEEALQETLCRVARYVRPFEQEETFWCWLTVLARSAVRDAGRKRQRYWTLLKRYALAWLPVAQSSEMDDGACLQELLQTSLGELEPPDRALLEDKYIARASLRELATRTGLTERAVESRLLRLRRHLRTQITRKLRHQNL